MLPSFSCRVQHMGAQEELAPMHMPDGRLVQSVSNAIWWQPGQLALATVQDHCPSVLDVTTGKSLMAASHSMMLPGHPHILLHLHCLASSPTLTLLPVVPPGLLSLTQQVLTYHEISPLLLFH